VGLLVAALGVVWSQRADVQAALSEVRAPAPLLIAGAIVLPAANWFLVSVSFWLLSSRYGRVGLGEMLSLVGAAWLLNYIPLRPGFFGRIAYHKRVNRISIRDSTKVLITGALQTLSAACVLLIGALAFEPRDSPLAWFMTILVPMFVIAPASGLVLRSRGTLAAVSGIVRVLDMLAWTARYWVAFRLLGEPISPLSAIIFAGVSQVALMIPLTGNGLGAREWGVGLAARWTPGSVGVHGAMAVGLAADLVNRAAEIIVSVPIGLCCAAAVARRLARGVPERASGALTPE